MKKLLATGLIASVAMASAEANNDCVNGGFFIQGGFGISTTKMKYKNDLKPQINALIAEEVEKMVPVVIIRQVGVAGAYVNDAGPGSSLLVYSAYDIHTHSAGMDATKTSLNKRKNLFQFEFGAGIDKRIGSVMLGIAVNFGKNCGNVKKKEKGIAYKMYTIQSLVLGTNWQNVPGLTHGVDQNPPMGGGAQQIPHVIALGQVPVGNAGSNYPANPVIDIVNNGAPVIVASDVLNNKLYQRDLEMEFKCKNKYYVSIMPRFGILVNPRLELFVAAGVKIKSDKYTMYVPSLKKSAKKTVTKCIPVVQVGLQYNFHSGMFANLSYTFNFKAKKTFKFKANNQIGMDTTVKHTLQNSSNDIKLGFGYRF